MATENKAKVLLKNVRLSYANIWTPKEDDNGALKYGTAILIPKSNKKAVADIKKAIEVAKIEGKSKIAGKNGNVPANIKTPLRDGDDDRPDDEVYAGCYFLNANSLRKPQIVDRQVNLITDQEEVYSGCYANVTVNFYAFSKDVNKGIACGLGNIQKVGDGERLGGGSTAEEDFEFEDNTETDDFLG